MIGEAPGGFRPDGPRIPDTGCGRHGHASRWDHPRGSSQAPDLLVAGHLCGVSCGDGGLVAAGFVDGAIRLCVLGHGAAGRPAAAHETPCSSGRAFTTDGRSVAAIDEFGEIRTWPVPEPLQDSSFDDLTLRIEARTGLYMETSLAISRLDGPVRATAGRRSRATADLSALLLSERLGRDSHPGRPDRRGARPPERGNRRREGVEVPGLPRRLGLPGPGPRRQKGTLPKPVGGSTASAVSVLLRRQPSGICRSLPSSAARPSRCSSMPSFRAIRFKVQAEMNLIAKTSN